MASFLHTATDWPVGTILVGIICLCALAILFIIASGVFIALDSWFLKEISGSAKVLKKTFVPKHKTTYYNVALKMPMMKTVADEWSLLVEVNGKTTWVSVDEKFYNARTVGSGFLATYVFGRLSGSLYLKSYGFAFTKPL